MYATPERNLPGDDGGAVRGRGVVRRGRAHARRKPHDRAAKARRDTVETMTTQHDMYWTQGLHRAVQQRPEETATIFGDRTRTFAEQADRVARLAGALRERGVRGGARVGILALNSDRYAEALLAIAWADGAFNVLDTMRSPADVTSMLSGSETEILFVDDAFASVVPQVQQAWHRLRTIVHMGEDPTPSEMLDYEELIACSAPVEDARRSGDELAGILHTGGTTDSPKAVMHTHRSMLTFVMALGATVPDLVQPDNLLLQVTPMSHISGVGAALTFSQFGRTFVPLPRFAPAALLEAVESHRITALFVVPPMLQQVVDHPDAVRRDLSCVRTIMYGASPITESVLERVGARFPRAGLAQIYAMTETTSGTLMTPDDHRPGPQRRSAGRAAIHSETRIVDSEDHDVPTGGLGEILLRGPGLMRGYWNDPDASAEALRGGWMHTGDVGYLDGAGYLYIVDRLKDLIIVEGDNVHSAEVENTLSSHPDVAACAVIGVPDGETGERVHAVVVARPGSDPDHEQLRTHCASLIAGFKVPREWEFVDALPTSPTGKVLKRSLRRPYWEGRERRIN